SVKVSTTNKKGANGLVMSVKIVDAMDFQGMLANTTVDVQMQLDAGTRCEFDTLLGTPVDIVDGVGKAKVVATGHGDIREVATPTFLRLCAPPEMMSSDFRTVIASLHLFDPTKGTILSGPYHLATTSPITSWKNAKLQVKTITGGDVQAKI